MKFKLGVERDAAAKEHQLKLVDRKKQENRAHHDAMSQSVRLLSTRVHFNLESEKPEAQEARQALKEAMYELETK